MLKPPSQYLKLFKRIFVVQDLRSSCSINIMHCFADLKIFYNRFGRLK